MKQPRKGVSFKLEFIKSLRNNSFIFYLILSKSCFLTLDSTDNPVFAFTFLALSLAVLVSHSLSLPVLANKWSNLYPEIKKVSLM